MITEKPKIESFAGIVSDILSGTPPLEAHTADAAAAKQGAGAVDEPPDSRAKIPRSVQRIIEDALSEEPQRRPFMSQLLNGRVLKSSVTGSRRRIAIVGSVAVATVSVGLVGGGC